MEIEYTSIEEMYWNSHEKGSLDYTIATTILLVIWNGLIIQYLINITTVQKQ